MLFDGHIPPAQLQDDNCCEDSEAFLRSTHVLTSWDPHLLCVSDLDCLPGMLGLSPVFMYIRYIQGSHV